MALMPFEEYAVMRRTTSSRHLTSVIENQKAALDRPSPEAAMRAVEDADRLAYALTEDTLWGYARRDLRDAVRQANRWLDSHSTVHGRATSRMIQNIKRDVAVSFLKEVMPYMDDEMVRYAVAGLSAQPFGGEE